MTASSARLGVTPGRLGSVLADTEAEGGAGETVRVLFVCSRNRLRSPTAEAVVSGWPGVSALSAGTAPDAEAVVSADLVEWADVVVAFESRHRRHLTRRFGPLLRDRRLVTLGVPDDFAFMDPGLVRLLQDRLPGLLGVERWTA